MKILVFGDIHGRPHWKAIVEKEQPDLTIFLGDYVSTHESYSEKDQIENLENILQYKEENPTKVVMLRGNHDLEALGYYWAECYPYTGTVVRNYMSENLQRFLNATQWLYAHDNILFAHAGVTNSWFENLKSRHSEVKNIIDINLVEPCEDFGFTPGPDNPYDGYGYSIYQSIDWVRPQSLVEDAISPEHIIQVVGHTTVGRIDNTKNNGMSETCEVWLCDCMPKQYLIIEDGTFKPTKNEEN